MIHDRLLAAGLLVTASILGGCATSRSELRLSSPTGTQTTAMNPNAPSAVIRTVTDERTFEQAPSDPSTPSLGFEGAALATAGAKLRAIGRKRNTFGQALGDVFLPEGQTVESVVRENLAAALSDAGFNVRNDAAADPRSLVIDVHIKQFWAWLRPGFWAITLNTKIATDLNLSTTSKTTPILIHVEESRQFATDSAWLETVNKALQAYRHEAVQKLPSGK